MILLGDEIGFKLSPSFTVTKNPVVPSAKQVAENTSIHSTQEVLGHCSKCELFPLGRHRHHVLHPVQ